LFLLISGHPGARSFLLDRNGRIIATYKSYKAGDEVKLQQEITALLKQ